MKKLFFSAVALVAFSSVSMANTIEIENFSMKNDCAISAAIITQAQEEEYHNTKLEEGIDACWDTYTYNLIYALNLYMCQGK